jgi:hypothetical protein
MAASAHIRILPPVERTIDPVRRKPVESKANPGGNRPIEVVCDRIVRDWERGVTLRSLGKMYELRVESLEGILRDRLRALESAMRKAGVAAICLLGLAVGVDAMDGAWNAGAPVARAFRVRSRRSRRDEAVTIEVEEHLRNILRLESPAAVAA